MISTWLAAVLALLGWTSWLMTKSFTKGRNEYGAAFKLIPIYLQENGGQALLSLVVTVAMWLIWWQAGLPMFQWAAGEFNWAVFFIAWSVPSFLDHMPGTNNRNRRPR